MNNEIHELSMDELDAASAGKITVVAEKGYYPGHRGGTCVPA